MVAEQGVITGRDKPSVEVANINKLDKVHFTKVKTFTTRVTILTLFNATRYRCIVKHRVDPKIDKLEKKTHKYLTMNRETPWVLRLICFPR